MYTETTTSIAALDFSFWFIFWISVVLLAGVTAVMLYFVWRYDRRRHPVPAQIEHNTTLEVIWTVIPALLVGAMFYFGWSGYAVARRVPPDAMTINVIGRMWSWQFEYPNGKVESELYVPVNRPIKLVLRSEDVNHSFFVAAFGMKEDLIPGKENYMAFEATRVDTYDVQCAEFCGTRHSAMLSKLHVLPQEEFDRWYNTITLVTEVTGEKLARNKGCFSCHSTDGSRLMAPSFKGLFDRREVVMVRGQEQSVTVDEDYLKESILAPNAKIAKGYPAGKMPSQEGLVSDDELEKLVDYIKSLE